ncbi:hypothetical protein CDN99_21655 [Roseateles aquatilis]|uniref:DUF1453 domain-containing protein n=1 Tax=Roseateles aquatilis TaxID=431061 RepID=A0A246IZD1_9BURK|nr:hypothetical protein [Roseateles aquatilis]OWQ85687.1 hypothetical protein CDN99_21655 [Roseateles aquatilis]
MNIPAPQTMLMSLGVSALIVWRVYKRIRRLVGRQQLSPTRPWFTVVLFPLLVMVIGMATLPQPQKTAMLIGGVLVGAGLGLYGHRLTRFEITPQGAFYTPNAHLGIALSLLFIGRLAYRLASVYLLGSGVAHLSGGMADAPPRGGSPFGDPSFLLSGWTLLIFGTLAGYYVCYAIGLLRWRSRNAAALAAAIG